MVSSEFMAGVSAIIDNSFSGLIKGNSYNFKCVVTDVWNASSEVTFNVRVQGNFGHSFYSFDQNELSYDLNEGEPNEVVRIKVSNKFTNPIFLDNGNMLYSGRNRNRFNFGFRL